MKKIFLTVLLACYLTTQAFADFNDGVYAYSRGEYEQAYITMRSLAESSEHGLASYYLGMMHLRGEGVEQSHKEAADWFRKAAQQRIKQAQYRLAELYMSGRGVPKDYEYAYAWYRVGAEHQHKRSIAALASATERLSPEELEEAEKLARKLIRQYGPKQEQTPTNR